MYLLLRLWEGEDRGWQVIEAGGEREGFERETVDVNCGMEPGRVFGKKGKVVGRQMEW